MTAIRQIVANPNTGCLIALRLDGSLARQEVDPDASTRVLRWAAIVTDDLPARAVQITVTLGDVLTVLTADGRLFEEMPPRPTEFKRTSSWKEVPTS